MTVSFNYIPADNRVPLFYAEMDNSAANTAQDSAPSLLIGMALSDAEMPVNQLVIMPSKDRRRKWQAAAASWRAWWKLIAVLTRSVNCGLSLCLTAGRRQPARSPSRHGNRCGGGKPVYRYDPSTDYRGR
jgi:hypothetical protein